MYRLKNAGDQTVIPEIVDAVATFVNTWNVQIDAIVPVPPSNTRRKHQPVIAVVEALSIALGVPLCDGCVTKVKSTGQLKDVFDFAKRTGILNGAFAVDVAKTKGQRLLLFDDLYHSGATVSTIAQLLMTAGAARAVYLLTLTHHAQIAMMSVFIGGSRAVSRLNDVILAKLEELIDRQCLIFVGDANGADKAVQQHFARRGYQHVLVYCMDECRNNIGNWPAKNVTRPSARKDFAYYAAKDQAMAQDAKCGIMLWDGKSKGTLNNIQQLILGGKKTLVYLATGNAFHKIGTEVELDTFLQRCDPHHVQQAQREIRTKLLARQA